MKLSYLPADLHFVKRADGTCAVSVAGKVVFSSPVEKKALKRFLAIREAHGADVPVPELSAEDRERLLRRELGSTLVNERHFERAANRKPRRSSRTFG